MLRELYSLSKSNHGLTLQPEGYNTLTISYAITLNADGKALSVETLDKKSNKLAVPDSSKRNFPGNSLIASESAEYLFGLGANGEKCQKAFVELHQTAFNQTAEPAIAAILKFAESGSKAFVADRPDMETWLNIEKSGSSSAPAKLRAVFLYETDPIYVHDYPNIQEFWGIYGASPSTKPGQCAITDAGEILTANFRGIKFLGGKALAITSAQNNSTRSYSGKLDDSGDISYANLSVKAYSAANTMLSALLASPDNCFRCDESNYLYWCEGVPARSVMVSKLLGAEDAPAQPADVKDYVSSIFKTGLSSQQMNTTAFYLIRARPSKGRPFLDAITDRTVGSLMSNATQFIERQLAQGGKAYGVWALAKCLQPKGAKDALSADVDALVCYAIDGIPLPTSFGARLLQRVMLSPSNRVHFALLNLLIYTKTMNLSTLSLSETRAYRAGQLYNTLERLSHNRTDKWYEGTTNIDRLYNTFLSMPAIALTRAMALIPSYSKVAKNYDFQVQRIAELYKLEDDALFTLPKTFTVTEKQLFLAGYQAESHAVRVAIAQSKS
ncbi:MAG: type I-C CRISPR-associated protein Cas8c/Csd1 [Phormidesmis sp. CAN_BIN36]|nr:type I-C CRISPR-associated protein Cas8c/Csd1 [Phormidesmis sp. CAN_BIN36]